MRNMSRVGVAWWLAPILVTLCAVPANGETRHALLVGCTRYPELPPARQLEGPANDVTSFGDLLTSRYDFLPENVVTLAEQKGNAQPTRANIKAEFARLAKVAKTGDLIVILLSGHGSQQPVENPDDPDNFEPDGLDQVFCPADVKSLPSNTSGKITNGIVDNDIRDWLAKILEQGAAVWITIDACHSGTMVRGADNEVARNIPPEELIPKELLDVAATRAARAGGGQRGVGAPASKRNAKAFADRHLVALYAAQRSEPTFERRLPSGIPEAKPYGLLTFALVQCLTECSAPITYRELVQKIYARYVGWGRTYPTPLLEGGDRDNLVLNTARLRPRSPVRLQRNTTGEFSVNAGAFHGLSAGSILTVYPPPGESSAEMPLGHLRVTGPRTLDAAVEPCDYELLPLRKDLPVGGRCEVAYLDYGLQPLVIAVDERTAAGDPLAPPEIARWRGELQKIGGGPHPLVRVVDSPRQADWLLRRDQERLLLVPASGWLQHADGDEPQRFGPIPQDQAAAWLRERFGCIARATSLLKLAGASPGAAVLGAAAGNLQVDVELIRFENKVDQTGKVTPWQDSGLSLREDDVIAFRVHNRSQATADVTLLFVDSGFGIDPLFPEPATVSDNRLAPGKDLTTPRRRVTATTVGLEHLVLIAVTAKPESEPADFGFLAQPTLERARTRGGRSLDSPLAQLLQTAVFQDGGIRGFKRREVSQSTLHLMSWQVRKK